MNNKNYDIFPFFFITFFLLLAHIANAHEYKMLPSTDADKKQNRAYVQCINIINNEPLDCAFTYTITGLVDPETSEINNGGHFHYFNRPLTFNGGDVEYAADQNQDPYIVSGTSLSTPPSSSAKIIYTAPTISGKVNVTLISKAPRGFRCVIHCLDSTTHFRQDIYDVGIDGLELLPDPSTGDFYEKVRNSDINHPNTVAFYGTPFAIGALKGIALNYHTLTTKTDPNTGELIGELLSINDMSLPRGGLFDIAGFWNQPHKEHRLGTSADINRNGIDCKMNHEMRLAVELIAFKVIRFNSITQKLEEISPLLCENEGQNYHIFLEI